ncbi:cytochrome P450 family protein [Ceratobasidium sp. AG-Ba]|nr:cytochrome P450 family protein [Ceratobasidium sp. AG-Ba]
MWYIGLTCLGASAGLGLLWQKRSRQAFLPPSPPGHWFWGNRELVSEQFSHIKLGMEVREQYGDIITLTSPFGATIIVNSIDVAMELLEKQAAITANRPRKVMMDDIMQWSSGVSWHPHNERHKKLRRIMASALSPAASRKYAREQTETALKISKVLMLSPPTFAQDMRQELGSLFMRIAYGHIAVENDPIIRMSHQALGYMFRGLFGYFWVDDLPFLRFLPEWLPGAEFKRLGKEGKRTRDAYVSQLFDSLLNSMRLKQHYEPSYASRLIEEKGGLGADPEDLDLIKWSAASIFGGGTSPAVAFIATFLIMSALYPEMSERARQEIDSLTERSRLPSLEDQEHAPYCNAFLQEITRTFPPAGLGW